MPVTRCLLYAGLVGAIALAGFGDVFGCAAEPPLIEMDQPETIPNGNADHLVGCGVDLHHPTTDHAETTGEPHATLRTQSVRQLLALKHSEVPPRNCNAAWTLLLRRCELLHADLQDATVAVPIADRSLLRQYCGFVECAIHAELPNWWLQSVETGSWYSDSSLLFKVDVGHSTHLPMRLPISDVVKKSPEGVTIQLGPRKIELATGNFDASLSVDEFIEYHCTESAAVLAVVGTAPVINIHVIDFQEPKAIFSKSLRITPVPGFSGRDTVRATVTYESGRWLLFAGCSDGMSVFALSGVPGPALCISPLALLWEEPEVFDIP